ncbi:hypothetical protein EDB87DRAFT_701307 [Lactarius vividus]|nr:hypothetical protein EDB87DRAFT_701307 [Lactarius vividus]
MPQCELSILWITLSLYEFVFLGVGCPQGTHQSRRPSARLKRGSPDLRNGKGLNKCTKKKLSEGRRSGWWRVAHRSTSHLGTTA